MYRARAPEIQRTGPTDTSEGTGHLHSYRPGWWGEWWPGWRGPSPGGWWPGGRWPGGWQGAGDHHHHLYDLAGRRAGWMEVHGMYGSPYTRKVQAALRYKQVRRSAAAGQPTGELGQHWHPGGLHPPPPDARQHDGGSSPPPLTSHHHPLDCTCLDLGSSLTLCLTLFLRGTGMTKVSTR